MLRIKNSGMEQLIMRSANIPSDWWMPRGAGRSSELVMSQAGQTEASAHVCIFLKVSSPGRYFFCGEFVSSE